MKKKIDVLDLQLGMYVSQLDRPWLETPFLFQGFELSSSEDLEQLKKHCKYVYIDTELGPDLTPKRANKASVARMRIIEEQEERIRHEVRALAEAPARHDGRRVYPDLAPFEREIPRAREIQSQTKILVRTTLEEVQKGRDINVPLAQKVVGNMVDSVIRNPDALVCLSQLKDVSEYTAMHSVRTCILALTFGRHLVLSKDELHALGMGALLHDIGMVKLPLEILEKSAALTPEEFELMTQHILWGLEIVRQSGEVPPAAIELIEQHHERHDGSGYVGKLKGDLIGRAGAIGAIVDVYDAITSQRVYSEPNSAEDALKRMYEWRHKDFNAELVEEFIKCMGIYPIGSLVEFNTGAVGVVITINRARRLKPKVVLLLTAQKSPLTRKVIVDLAEQNDAMGKELRIKRVLPVGTYGINPMDHLVQF
ncbi:MAG: HD-GYP domain-containing protein [Acidiferrobacterales bacterium]